MTEATFRSDMGVTLINSMGDDEAICMAARVSTLGAASIDSIESNGLIRYLMNNRHGSPFEHLVFTWLIEAPIFVGREFFRHRMASYNEESGRYKQLDPIFYIPNDDRPLQQEGKPGEYRYVPGTEAQVQATQSIHRGTAEMAYSGYKALLEIGVAREVARMSLPVNIYSSFYVTMNARGLMNFLSLRTESPAYAKFQSFPQKEIAMVADKMEQHFLEVAPLTAKAWDDGGRVAP